MFASETYSHARIYPPASPLEAVFGGAGQPGMCWDDDGMGPVATTCIPFASAPSQCAAPRTAGYVACKSNKDQSTLFCITPP